MDSRVKNILLGRTARATLTDQDIVEKIISFQGKDASRAMKDVNEVELSGFGKFYISSAKIRKKIASLEYGLFLLNEKILIEDSDVLQEKVRYMTEQLNSLRLKEKK